tara:strand:- start:28 stop:186 length:159 start_codon:yes stop_codon:yes gene_type:complete
MFKVWLHIEEIDDDGEALEPDIGLPEELGAFETLGEAEAAVEYVIAGFKAED